LAANRHIVAQGETIEMISRPTMCRVGDPPGEQQARKA